MRHEKIFKRDDGTKVRVTASMQTRFYDDGPFYTIDVETCLKGKRKWTMAYSMDGYDFRSMKGQDRALFILQSQLKHCTVQEMQEVKLELWEKLKPELK